MSLSPSRGAKLRLQEYYAPRRRGNGRQLAALKSEGPPSTRPPPHGRICPNQAMRSAHTHRDALRYEGERPNSAVLWVPAGGGAPWLEARGFIEQEGVGVRVLTP